VRAPYSWYIIGIKKLVRIKYGAKLALYFIYRLFKVYANIGRVKNWKNAEKAAKCA